ncbi:MAG: hypothetical protein WBA57_02075 [Elainellaceae cyanobacterium]
MKPVANLLIALIIALLSVAIAIISVQNAFIPGEDGQPQLVTLKFLGLESIALPFGVVLAIAFGLGVIGSAIILWVVRNPLRSR